MSYGLPVIASFGDGTEADLVRDGLNGFIFEADRADSLTEKLTFLLSDPDRAREMGQASLSIVRDEINIERMVASVKRAIDTVVGRGEHSL
jgi:glycosyltransferase involved in cell wall biosynthesis